MSGRWMVSTAVLASMVALGALAGPAQAVFGPLGEDFRISFMGPNGSVHYEADNPVVAYNPVANEYLVVWSADHVDATLVDEEFEIFAQRVSASGALLGARIRVSDMGPDG